jgi:hypothetical protein
MRGTPVAGALESLRAVVQMGKFQEVWIVSKCGPKVQKLTLEWLGALDFWCVTGIPQDHIRFCLEFWGKDPICRDLGVTHFVDDRPKVLNCLHTVDNLIAFNPKPKAISDYKQPRPMAVVANWQEALQLLL